MQSDKLKIFNTTGSYKVGYKQFGPRMFMGHELHTNCMVMNIFRDEEKDKPCVWVLGTIESVMGYLYLARSKGVFSFDEASFLLNNIEYAKKRIPKKAIEMLANALSLGEADIARALKKSNTSLGIVYRKNASGNTLDHMTSALDRLQAALKLSSAADFRRDLELCKITVLECYEEQG